MRLRAVAKLTLGKTGAFIAGCLERPCPRPVVAASVAVPVVLVFWVSACFVWNHFVSGPYLLDSGWFSGVIHRQGLVPDNPPCAHPSKHYFSVHLSLLLSAASLASYALPLDRVTFYCFFQGVIYAPLAAVAAVLFNAKVPTVTYASAGLVLLVALAFASNGVVLSSLGYPHFEIFMSVGLCVMIAAIAMGRGAMAWAGLLLAACTREDGGFHAAGFVAAALLVSVSGRAFPLSQRLLFKMALVSVFLSLTALMVQRVGFDSANTFRLQFSGDPPFAHVTLDLIKQRALALPSRAAFVVLPFIGAVAIAAIARDVRYLFGWVAVVPWSLACLTALSEGKASLGTYNGFPFVASLFWVGACGRVVRPVGKVDPGAAALGVVSLLSILGAHASHPGLWSTLRFASIPSRVDYSGIAQFSRDLEANSGFYSNILVDPGVAAWAIRGVSRERCVASLASVAAPHSYDGIAFFRTGLLGRQLPRFIAKSPFSQCGRIPTSEVFLCTRPHRALPHPFVAASVDG